MKPGLNISGKTDSTRTVVLRIGFMHIPFADKHICQGPLGTLALMPKH